MSKKRETSRQVHWYPKEEKNEMRKMELILQEHPYIKSFSGIVSWLVNEKFETKRKEFEEKGVYLKG
jgi:hypothetical protein